MREDILLKAKSIFQPRLEKEGYVLVDLRLYRNQHGENVVEALVDRVEGGITLEECACVAAELGNALEAESGLPASYLLDVSSPGVDRPLATEQDFRRVIGRAARFFLKEPVEGRLEHCGIVEGTDAESVRVKTKDTIIQIPLEKINKAKQVIV